MKSYWTSSMHTKFTTWIIVILIYRKYVYSMYYCFTCIYLLSYWHFSTANTSFCKNCTLSQKNTITLKALKTFLQMYCTDTCTTHVDYFNCCSLPRYYDVTHICLEYKLFINWNILLNLWNEYECFLLATIVHKEKQTVLRYIK